VRHQSKQTTKSRSWFDNGATKVETFHFQSEILVLLPQALNVRLADSPQEFSDYFLHQLLNTTWWFFKFDLEGHFIFEDECIGAVSSIGGG
jgi:hypothetical protein